MGISAQYVAGNSEAIFEVAGYDEKMAEKIWEEVVMKC